MGQRDREAGRDRTMGWGGMRERERESKRGRGEREALQ